MVYGEIFQTDGVVINKLYCTSSSISVRLCFFLFFTDLSALALPCYVGINSSGKKACTFLLSSFVLRAGLSYMNIFCSCLLV